MRHNTTTNRGMAGAVLLLFFLTGCSNAPQQNQTEKAVAVQTDTAEPYRPQLHFTPATGWMNDPNGMVYYKGTYHLFYQHYPDSTVWGPMHWGHATSPDLVHWQPQPIALYPDSLGYIFSGSAVVDSANTSGFGKEGQVPLVAIFTYHDPKGEKAQRNDYQSQGLAYSLDAGKTWTKYSNNPVLKSPGIRDFRDPKVAWHGATKKWIMTLAVQDQIFFYSSPNLKNWTRESAFGKTAGAHGGVWECPDLFPLYYNGQQVWVLIVNINPGGPNGGSATQYFTGNFDGHTFTPNHSGTQWLDYGPDEYAGITFSNTGNRTLFLGWMSNWQYADKVPTKHWRSAMTVPRELSLTKVGDTMRIRSMPVAELQTGAGKTITLNNVSAGDYNLSTKSGTLNGPAQIHLTTNNQQSFSITFSNEKGENVVVGYDKAANQYYCDRRAAGNTGFDKGFAARHTAPRFATSNTLELTLVLDVASVEMFADGGLTTLTQIFFPTTPFTNINIKTPTPNLVKTLTFTPLKPA